MSVQVRLGKSQLAAIFGGQVRRPLDWEVLRAIVEACYQHASLHDRSHLLSLTAGVDQYWRPRHAVVEHVYSTAFTVPPAAAVLVPRQLPSAAPYFVCRESELDALDQAARTGSPLLLTGPAGVGKTTLAVQWAHRVASDFPDGQLYVNLRGLSAAEVLRGFLGALDVPGDRVPDGLDNQAALFRSLLAGKRMLIVLDNVRDAAQVRPLLPGTSTCQVLMTSRDQLLGLIARDGVHPVLLDPFSADEARTFLALRLGTERVDAEPVAVGRIVERCAGLPLALAVLAARAATYRESPLEPLVIEEAWAEARTV